MQILDSIVDFSKYSNVVDNTDMNLRTKSVQKCLCHITSGWCILFLWKNREDEWILLNQIKQHISLKIAEFSFSRVTYDECAFK